MYAAASNHTKRSTLSAALAGDEGMALATVAAISAILFILATMLVTIATQQQVDASNQLQRTKALHAADAGISAACYLLSRGARGSQASTSGATTDATWAVSAVSAGQGSAITQLTATGTVPAANGSPSTSRVVMATVRPASFSDYMFLTNDYFHLGSNGLVKGNVRSNSYIINDGEITGYTYAASTISGAGTFDKAQYPNYKTQSFAVVDYGGLKTFAVNDGTYWGDSGTYPVTGTTKAHYIGYKVDLSGTGGTVTKIKSISTTTGVIGVDSSTATSFTVPADGVLYFDDPVWLSGTYGCKVTVVCGDDTEDPGTDSTYGRNAPGMGSKYGSVSKPATNTAFPNSTADTSCSNAANSSFFLWNNLVSADASNPNYVCGIVTPGDISIISEYPDTVTPTNLTIQAAMLTTQGSLHADWGPKPSGSGSMVKTYLKILGAEAMWEQGFVLSTSGSTTTMGFSQRDYWYDNHLDITTPPNFPGLGDGSQIVNSWVEH